MIPEKKGGQGKNCKGYLRKGGGTNSSFEKNRGDVVSSRGALGGEKPPGGKIQKKKKKPIEQTKKNLSNLNREKGPGSIGNQVNRRSQDSETSGKPDLKRENDPQRKVGSKIGGKKN